MIRVGSWFLHNKSFLTDLLLEADGKIIFDMNHYLFRIHLLKLIKSSQCTFSIKQSMKPILWVCFYISNA